MYQNFEKIGESIELSQNLSKEESSLNVIFIIRKKAQRKN